MYYETRTGCEGVAVFDAEDIRYRYLLTLRLGEGEDSVGFVMLNPSEADENRLDDTVSRCITIAQRQENVGTLEIGNLYAWYAKDPTDLLDAPPPKGPIGPHNDACLNGLAGRCSRVVAAWGDRASKRRANYVLGLLWEGMMSAGRTPSIYRLGRLNSTGHPRHPSRLRSDTPLQLWRPSTRDAPPRIA